MKANDLGFQMYCFGGFRFVSDKTKNIDFFTNKERALLVYLAVETPKVFRRSHLAGLLWCELSEKRALHNLRQTLYQLKKTWNEIEEDQELLLIDQDTITIHPRLDLWVDVLAFEEKFYNATRFMKDHSHFNHLDIQLLKNAMALFRGPFLDRFEINDTPLFNEWETFQRERTSQMFVQGLNILIDYYIQRGDFSTAGRLSDQMIEITPWDESAYAKSMQLYAAGKFWHMASGKFQKLRTYLKENFAEDPQPSIQNLNNEILNLSIKGEAFQFIDQTINNNLPEFSSSFVGRGDELLALSGMIADPNVHLISLIGIGGIGKTRLAIEVGSLFTGLFKDGVYYIPLKSISSKESFFHYLGNYLGYSFSGKASPEQQLLNYLRRKQCLIILDGCEKLAIKDWIKSFVSDLLAGAENVMILAASRKALCLDKEYIYTLPGLNIENSHRLNNEDPDAVSLFKKRVRQADPHFEFSIKNLPLVFDLCDQVEGHPLSIELMASAMASHSFGEVFSRFEDSQIKIHHLLPEFSIKNPFFVSIFENTWDSLPDLQKNALCCLSHFRGGFLCDAAVKVTGTSERIINSLCEKSLIRKIDSERYDFHEIILSFIAEKAEVNEFSKLSVALHAQYFTGVLEDIAEVYRSGGQVEALLVIEQDLDNILSAWRYYCEQKEVSVLENCIDIFYQYFNIRSFFEEGFSLFQETIQESSYLDPFDRILGILANRLGNLAFRLHQNEMAFQMFTRAKNIFEREKEIGELGISYLGLGRYFLRQKNIDKSLFFSNSGLACFEKVGDKFHQGRGLYLKGMIYQRFADYPTAKDIFTAGLRLSREVNDQRGVLLNLGQLAGHACNEGNYDIAEDYYLECLALSRAFKDRYQQAVILNNLASVYHPRKEFQCEEEVLTESLEICREIGDLDGQAIALSNLGEMGVVNCEFEQAIAYSKEALEIALQLGEQWTIIVVYDILGCAYTGLHDSSTAKQCFRRALQLAINIRSWDLLTRCAVNLSEALLSEGNNQAAIRLLNAALAHQSILFEYGLKAETLLTKLGVEYEGEEDEAMIISAIEDFLS